MSGNDAEYRLPSLIGQDAPFSSNGSLVIRIIGDGWRTLSRPTVNVAVRGSVLSCDGRFVSPQKKLMAVLLGKVNHTVALKTRKETH